MDDCGICSGGNTGHAANSNKDCSGECFGSAFLNECGTCVGGNTGIQVDSGKDCNGVCGGDALIDDCGICSGGNTGFVPNAAKDCNGVCFGAGVLDDCGVCEGNNSTCGNCNPLDVTSLTLVYAGTEGDIGPLTDGMVINKSQYSGFSIRADICEGGAVQSVQFILNGNIFRTENVAPYALNGDKNGSYYPWNPAVGIYTLTVTGYSAKSATGTAGAPMTITFEVVAFSYKKDEKPTIAPTEPDISVYPNPNMGNFNVELNLVSRNDLTIEVFSQLGQLIYSYSVSDYLGEFHKNIELDQPSGIYMMRVSIGEQWFIRQIAIR